MAGAQPPSDTISAGSEEGFSSDHLTNYLHMKSPNHFSPNPLHVQDPANPLSVSVIVPGLELPSSERKYENHGIKESYERPNRDTLQPQNRERALSGSHIPAFVDRNLTAPEVCHRKRTINRSSLSRFTENVLAKNNDENAEIFARTKGSGESFAEGLTKVWIEQSSIRLNQSEKKMWNDIETIFRQKYGMRKTASSFESTSHKVAWKTQHLIAARMKTRAMNISGANMK